MAILTPMFTVHVFVFSRVQLFVTPRTAVCQAPLSMGFPRQKYCRGLPFRPPGDLPAPGMKPTPPVSPALAGRFFITESTGKPDVYSTSH